MTKLVRGGVEWVGSAFGMKLICDGADAGEADSGGKVIRAKLSSIGSL